MNLATKDSRPAPLRRVSYQTESIGDLMMENSNAVRLARVVGGAAVLAGLAASISLGLTRLSVPVRRQRARLPSNGSRSIG